MARKLDINRIVTNVCLVLCVLIITGGFTTVNLFAPSGCTGPLATSEPTNSDSGAHVYRRCVDNED